MSRQIPLAFLAALFLVACSADDKDPDHCQLPADCVGVDKDCQVRTCLENICGLDNLPAGTLCDEDGGEICDGQGACVPASCTDGFENGSETGPDCGGQCPSCANGLGCAQATDCASGYCDEGGECAACTSGSQCAALGDSYCSAGVCTARKEEGSACVVGGECRSEHCSDGVCCQSACDGSCERCNSVGSEGACTPKSSGDEGDPTCSPYLCDGSSGDCPDTCRNDQDCVAGGYCDLTDNTCAAQLLPDGAACTDRAQCANDYCVEQVCCAGPCDQDCDSCLQANTGQPDGNCAPIQAGTECRAAAGDCDLPEECDGTGDQCPADVFASGSECRAVAGDCDLAEVCDGSGSDCPPDLFDTGSPCRAAAGVCDVAEACDGTSAHCPLDAFDSSSQCRAAVGLCDLAEQCDGTGVNCPADSFDTGSECRPAAGPCDASEVCDGSSANCPADLMNPGSECRPAAGLCDVAEVCDGTGSDCPTDLLDPGNLCRPAAGDCDVAEMCDGSSVDCPTDGYQTGTECRATNGLCDVAEVCDGSSADCPTDTFDTGTECRAAAGDCDVAEACDGTSADCPTDSFDSGSECRAAAGDCDVAESCDGSGADCPTDVFATGNECRSQAGPCDVAEVCDGTSANCPSDTMLPASTVCRAAGALVDASCDVPENCTGSGAACPSDQWAADGTSCDDLLFCTGLGGQELCSSGLCQDPGEPCPTWMICDEQFDTCLDNIWINEIHYDNESTDTDEGVEIAGPAGSDMTGWSIVLYNGSGGAQYGTIDLSGTIPDQQNGYGALWFFHAGVQNGAPDGLALVDSGGSVVQFLSYEGSFTASGGPADGMDSTDIGVAQTTSTPLGTTLQLSGSGTSYSDFSWTSDNWTQGAPNTGQTFP